MTENAEILTTRNVTLSPPKVVVLAYDGLCTFEFGVAVEIFGLPRPEMGDSWYRFAVAAVDDGELRATGGIRIVSDGGLALLNEADTIVVPGWRGLESEVPQALCRGAGGSVCAWLQNRLYLFRGICARRRRIAQRPTGHHPLALYCPAAGAFFR